MAAEPVLRGRQPLGPNAMVGTGQPHRPRRILIVDDSLLNREIVKAQLSTGRYEVIEAEGGAEALSLVRSRSPELVLLDLVMPGMDGLTVCRALRCDPETAALPVILLTAADTREARVDGLAAGADDFVTKPFDAAELIARIEAHLRRADFEDRAVRLEGALLATRSMNHEVNNPLMAILAVVDTLSARHSGDPETLRLIGEIQDACDRIGGVLHRLANLTAVETSDTGDAELLEL